MQLARGLVAIVVTLSAIAIVFAVIEHPLIQSGNRYQAIFHDAGGLDAGDDVTLQGTRIGDVSAISLSDGNALVVFSIDANQELGSLTTAAIRPETATETTGLVLRSLGSNKLHPGDTIPLERTISYSPSGDAFDLIPDGDCLVASTVDQPDALGVDDAQADCWICCGRAR